MSLENENNIKGELARMYGYREETAGIPSSRPNIFSKEQFRNLAEIKVV